MTFADLAVVPRRLKPHRWRLRTARLKEAAEKCRFLTVLAAPARLWMVRNDKSKRLNGSAKAEPLQTQTDFDFSLARKSRALPKPIFETSYDCGTCDYTGEELTA